MKAKLIKWIKNPRNYVFIIVMIIAGICGIIENKLAEVITLYVFLAVFGLVIGIIIGLVKWLFNKF